MLNKLQKYTASTSKTRWRLRSPMDLTVTYPIYIKLTALMSRKLSFYNAGVRLVCLVMARHAVPRLSLLGRSRPDVSEARSSVRLPSLIDTRWRMMAGWPNVRPEVDWLITSRTEAGVRQKSDRIDIDRQVLIKWENACERGQHAVGI